MLRLHFVISTEIPSFVYQTIYLHFYLRRIIFSFLISNPAFKSHNFWKVKIQVFFTRDWNPFPSKLFFTNILNLNIGNTKFSVCHQDSQCILLCTDARSCIYNFLCISSAQQHNCKRNFYTLENK